MRRRENSRYDYIYPSCPITPLTDMSQFACPLDTDITPHQISAIFSEMYNSRNSKLYQLLGHDTEHFREICSFHLLPCSITS